MASPTVAPRIAGRAQRRLTRRDRRARRHLRSVLRAPVSLRRRLPLLAVILSVVAIVALGSMLQARLIAGQRHLDEVNRRIEESRIRRDELRRREAGLRSPAQIAQIASDDLGMVRAAPPALVTPRPLRIGPTPTSVP